MAERLERLKNIFDKFRHNIRTQSFLEYVEFANESIDEMEDNILIQDFYDFLAK